MLIHKTTGRRITNSQYEQLSYYEKVDYVPENTNRSSSSGDMLTSGIIGAVTDSALLGGLLGGSFIGGILGDMSDGDLWD